jgi:ribonuclease HI
VEGEAWTLLQAMKEANHKSLDRIQFESDSHVFTEAIQIRHNGISEFNLIVVEIIILSCVSFEVKFVRRQTNMVSCPCSGGQILGKFT